jgi:hypothetical protein
MLIEGDNTAKPTSRRLCADEAEEASACLLKSSGLTWRLARRYDAGVVRQVSDADVGANVVLVFKVVGRGNTSLVFALTRGDTSARAVKSATHKVHSG